MEILQTCVDSNLRPYAIVCYEGSNNRTDFRNLYVNKKKKHLFFLKTKIFFVFSIFLKYCRLALQVLSHTISTWIKMAMGMGQLKYRTAEHTAEFIKFMNTLFDCINSYTFYTIIPYDCAISNTDPIVLETLAKSLNRIDNLRKITNCGLIIVPWFSGLALPITSTISLYKELKESNKDCFTITRKRNQDFVENLFSIFKQKGGYNKKPTTRVFRTFRSVAVNSFLKESDISNWQADEERNLDIFSSAGNDFQILNKFGTFQLVHCYIFNVENKKCFKQWQWNVSRSKILSMELYANECFTGYLANKTINKYKCRNCKLIKLKKLSSHR